MVLVSYSGREINAKLVYYGPGLSGKTTNLEFIYSSIPQGQRGKMVSMKTKTERTLFFDFLPVHLGELSGFKTRFLLYTVPGQVYYNATRKLVLKGVDAVVFVADSKRGKMDENVESLENLKENLKDLGLTLDKLPWVIQYNKRDLSDIYTIEELEAVLNPGRAPAYEGVASTGGGVVETFKGVSRLLLRKLAKDVGVPVVGSTVEGQAGPAAPAVDRAEAFPAPSVPDVPVSVYAAAPVNPTWASPVSSAPSVPVTTHTTDSSWTPEADTGLGAPHFKTESSAVAGDVLPPPEPETAVAVSGSRFPPVAEPVRIPRSESDDASVWSGPGDDSDGASERHVSVGERLRRWLSRSPEPFQPTPELVAAVESTGVQAVEPAVEQVVEPAVVQAVEPAVQPAVARAMESAVEPAAEPSLDSAVATFHPSEIPVFPLAAEPSTISLISAPKAVDTEMPTAQVDASAESLQSRPTTFPPSKLVSSATPAALVSFATPSTLASAAPLPAPATQPAMRRRRPREIIVPLELSPDDLADGVVLKVAIRMQQIAGDAEDEADQYAA